MDAVELDNPIWATLRSRHRTLARSVGGAARFEPDVAPFLGVANTQTDIADAVASLLTPDETVYLLGVAPTASHGMTLKAYPLLAQMLCTALIEVMDGPEVIELSGAHRADVLELTALVYPHYFRPRTMELGRYVGIYHDGRLAAMAGERLGTDTYQEISAICTHPDFSGRGYARRLTAILSNENLARGRTPFLHVSHDNHRALQMYAQLGYRQRRDIGFWSLRRA